MEIKINDIVTLKKQHPCGCSEFEVIRIGADIKFKCLSCNHEIMVPRSKAMKMIKSIKNEL